MVRVSTDPAATGDQGNHLMSGPDPRLDAARTCLYVEASPRGQRSTSSALAREFLEQLRQTDASLKVDRLALWDAPLPEFNGAVISAKYAKLAGKAMSADEEEAWANLARIVERVKQADAVVIATPMWNLGIPYKLKHWIDLITQPGLTFSFNPETGYRPLMPERPLLAIVSSAGDFKSGESYGRPDLAAPYLRAAFRFLGFQSPAVVVASPTLGPDHAVTAGRHAAREQLSALAPGFMLERA